MPKKEDQVLMEQTLLKVDEIFVYRVPPMKSSGGHRAEDWNLPKPLATCSLLVMRRNDALVLNMMAEKPKEGGPKGAVEEHLFAQCNIELDLDDEAKGLDHWVETVADSSRYFVIRILDLKTGREAQVGMGFRERADATNFRMSLQEYERALTREKKGEAAAKERELTSSLGKLGLKDGEKLNIKLPGGGGGSKKREKKGGLDSHFSQNNGVLLKKPPPPADDEITIAPEDFHILRKDARTKKRGGDEDNSEAAIGELDDNDEWGEFEGGGGGGGNN
eukprot:CAMPEP_0118707398 /NCGR_PEP_ID=MMETSP0800-20121206/21185_1 /TAXON_ID=210618 ORGANISM="Striatella unipunctata, Strain CCMP2910" /NCGR_SAMPLE_ID=MMETSP0800 /ASSEMBLY_ACC=CAM_ASM_000638 /LENGTH=276 /DNA_ID=CAMNT_0006610227 /DNA_START=10 /DNA_END=840 /DNA_ORIENTATION=-